MKITRRRIFGLVAAGVAVTPALLERPIDPVHPLLRELVPYYPPPIDFDTTELMEKCTARYFTAYSAWQLSYA